MAITICPRCSRPTKLVWTLKADAAFVPACHRCIEKIDGFSRHDEEVYDLHYIPIITSTEAGFQLTRGPKVNFTEVRRYLDSCLDPASADADLHDLLVTDVWTMIHIFRWLQERSESSFHRKVCNRILSYMKQVVSGSRILVSKRLPWSFLPPGKSSVERVVSHLRRLQRIRPEIRIEEDRLRYISSFQPDAAYLGRDSFEGYVAFYFAERKACALECAFYGNALYILTGHWEALSRYSRYALNTQFQQFARRVIHDSSFEWNLKSHFEELGIIKRANGG